MFEEEMVVNFSKRMKNTNHQIPGRLQITKKDTFFFLNSTQRDIILNLQNFKNIEIF